MPGQVMSDVWCHCRIFLCSAIWWAGWQHLAPPPGQKRTSLEDASSFLIVCFCITSDAAFCFEWGSSGAIAKDKTAISSSGCMSLWLFLVNRLCFVFWCWRLIMFWTHITHRHTVKKPSYIMVRSYNRPAHCLCLWNSAVDENMYGWRG